MNDSDLLKFLFQYVQFYSGPVNFFVEVIFENMLLKRMIRILNHFKSPIFKLHIGVSQIGTRTHIPTAKGDSVSQRLQSTTGFSSEHLNGD